MDVLKTRRLAPRRGAVVDDLQGDQTIFQADDAHGQRFSRVSHRVCRAGDCRFLGFEARVSRRRAVTLALSVGAGKPSRCNSSAWKTEPVQFLRVEPAHPAPMEATDHVRRVPAREIGARLEAQPSVSPDELRELRTRAAEAERLQAPVDAAAAQATQLAVSRSSLPLCSRYSSGAP